MNWLSCGEPSETVRHALSWASSQQVGESVFALAVLKESRRTRQVSVNFPGRASGIIAELAFARNEVFDALAKLPPHTACFGPMPAAYTT